MLYSNQKLWKGGVQVEINFYLKAPDRYEIVTAYTTTWRVPLKLLKSINLYYREEDIRADILRIVGSHRLNSVTSHVHTNFLPYKYVRQGDSSKYLVRPQKCGVVELRHITGAPSDMYIQFAKMKQNDVIKYLRSLQNGV
jgi:hypothetical protein